MSAPGPLLGIVEGFYGRPWSWPQRERMARFGARHGYRFYLYAPKNDPLHRNRWRAPYLPEEVARFAAFGRLCRRLGIELCVGLSPLGPEVPGDPELVVAKLGRFLEAGLTSFCVLLDDMEMSPPVRQAALANGVWRTLGPRGATRVALTPTEYHGTGRTATLAALGRELDPSVDVLWTGPDVCSETITAAHVRTVAAALRRRPLIWDNYPVNDLGMQFDPHLRPLRGREPSVLAEVAGMAFAAGPGSEAGKVALATAAAWFADPDRYDPELAWLLALDELAGGTAHADALATLGGLARRSALEPGLELESRFAAALERFWTERGVDELAALDALEAELASLRTAVEVLLGPGGNRALLAEVRPWAHKLRWWLEAIEGGLRVLRTGAGAAGALAAARRARESPYWVMGDLPEQFARRCLWAIAGADPGFFV
ncbi:MAG TPA: beta-N-acetylglucosaminidase domain-containing protein [Candidatus Dormibacteraeota bacterium]|nr:beta-N-acetylglucosaminidase domain-containing protein [Candidatus Dormibacteraeota bacterium]